MTNLYAVDLDRNAANYTPLTPLSLVARTAYVYPDQLAVVHGERRYTWAETYARSRRLASALTGAGIGTGDTVALMAANTPEMIEAAFRRADDGRRAQHAQHPARCRRDRVHAQAWRGETADHRHRILADDRRRARPARRPIPVIDIVDPLGGRRRAARRRRLRAVHRRRRPGASTGKHPDDEWQAIALNYTSGTTGNPKGVVYHHRGAYLNALSNIIDWGMPRHAVYLWTLPMFHCNGWCFPWTVAASAGTNVCLRRVEARRIFDAIRAHGVTHYCGAPIVHAMLINAPDEWKRGINHRVELPGGRRGAARVGHRGHAADGLRHHPRLRPDRDLRAGRGLRQAQGVGALDIGARTERNGRQGVRYTCAGRHDCARSGNR